VRGAKFAAVTSEAAARNEMLIAARSAGLRYVDPADPGIRRVRSGRGFRYEDPDEKRVRDAATLSRISSLVIPPAWRDVWISPSAVGHIQATGRDARGRLQYRYHPLWAQFRDATKYDRTIAFARALPRLRRRVARDLGLRGLPRQKVIAAVVRMLEMSLIRVGNEEYARDNASFGLTTLRSRHAEVRGASLKLTFRGKGGKQHSIGLRDKRLARVIRACQDLPGQRLLQYEDEDDELQRRLGRCERLPARCHGRGVLGQGLPNVGGNGAGGGRAELNGRGEQQEGSGERGGQGGGCSARQHASRVPQVLHPSRDRRSVRKRAAGRCGAAPYLRRPWPARRRGPDAQRAQAGRSGCEARLGFRKARVTA
jgi:DNA topoisomerase IB